MAHLIRLLLLLWLVVVAGVTKFFDELDEALFCFVQLVRLLIDLRSFNIGAFSIKDVGKRQLSVDEARINFDGFIVGRLGFGNIAVGLLLLSEAVLSSCVDDNSWLVARKVVCQINDIFECFDLVLVTSGSVQGEILGDCALRFLQLSVRLMKMAAELTS